MSKNGLTEIICVIDKSGSMDSVKDDAIGGFNAFLNEQKKLEDNTIVSLVLFDTDYNLVHSGEKIKNVDELSNRTFQPGGMTALYDAVGITIDNVSKRHSNLKSEVPEKVLFTILTDGHENSSREYTINQIKEKIELHQEKHNWKFIFLAANQDAVLSGSRMGIKRDYSIDVNYTKDGIRNSFCEINEAVHYIKGKRDMKDWKREMIKKRKEREKKE